MNTTYDTTCRIAWWLWNGDANADRWFLQSVCLFFGDGVLLFENSFSR